MQYLIGIDGGGTKSKCLAADSEGRILFNTEGGGTNLLISDIGIISKNIFRLINSCCSGLKINNTDIKQIVIGTAGAGRKTDAENLEKEFLNLCSSKGIHINSFKVVSDIKIALEGAFPGTAGNILIAGTGSIIYGKDENGNIFRSGGFGRLIGDEGGGYSIGKKALQVISKSFDGRIKPAKLSDHLMENFNISSQDELINIVYKDKLDVASIAPLVLKAAGEGDATALKIIDEESDELLLLISAQLNNMNTNKLKLCFIGGLIDNDNLYSQILKEKISKKFPQVEIKKPVHSPEMGAVLIAKEFLTKSNYI